MTQVSLAIAALLEGWLSPKQLTEKSGRANPNGLARDVRKAAFDQGLYLFESWVTSEDGKRYKVRALSIDQRYPRPAPEGAIYVYVPLEQEIAARIAEAERSVGAVNTARSDVSAGPRKGSRTGGRDSRPSPSRWQDRVGVSGAARATGGEQGELWRERG